MIEDLSIRGAVAAAAAIYRSYPNVCGISYGAKFKHEAHLPGFEAVQFFVTEKTAKENLNRLLPKYVFARHSDGSLDRSRCIVTDVIELRNLKMCCVAGDEVASVGGSTGTANLIFRNKDGSDSQLLLTCAHVVGDLSASPASGELRGGNRSCLFRAQTRANTVVQRGELEFDIALGEFLFSTAHFSDLGVAGLPTEFRRFGTPEDLERDAVLDCVSPISGDRTLSVRSEVTEFRQVETPSGAKVTVHNLIACQGTAEVGDSGGIVFVGDRAVGIVVAKADANWVFIHELSSAVRHLEAVSGGPIVCFDTTI